MIKLYTTPDGSLDVVLKEGTTPDQDLIQLQKPDGSPFAWIEASNTGMVAWFRDLQISVEPVIQAYAQHCLGRARARNRARQAMGELIHALGDSPLGDYTVTTLDGAQTSVVVSLSPQGALALAALLRGEIEP